MKKKKLLKKRKSSKKVSAKTKKVLAEISERSGISVDDFITICCQNALLDGALHVHSCASCGRENWRDKWCLVAKMFGVERGSGCAFCGSEEDWETRAIDDFVGRL